MYDLDLIFNANNTVEIITALNTASNNWLLSFFFIIFYIAIMVWFERQNMRVTIMVTSFSMIIVGTLLYSMGWIPFNFLIVPVICSLCGIFIYMFMD